VKTDKVESELFVDEDINENDDKITLFNDETTISTTSDDNDKDKLTEQQQQHQETTNEAYSLSKELVQLAADDVWKALLRKGHYELNSLHPLPTKAQNLVSIEVGMHLLNQCMYAAKNNFTAYCLEPSPKSYQTILQRFQYHSKLNPDAAKRINLYNVAAGNTTGTMIPFTSQGSTGDHIGSTQLDMWMMKVIPQTNTTSSSSNSINVPTVKLDDLIENKIKPTDTYNTINTITEDTDETASIQDNIDKIYSLKIDTQGFEPSVFSGLSSSIQNHKIQYILFEYWPKGMDLLQYSNLDTKCDEISSTAPLQQLAKAGYALYPLQVVTHPKYPKEAKKYIESQEGRPFGDFKSFCMWHYEIDKLFPSTEYHMGYWTDILAISSEVKDLDEKVKRLPTIIKELHEERKRERERQRRIQK